MTPEAFIAKWQASTLTERSAAQQHFLDLCELLDVPKPADVDQHGEFYTFERSLAKSSGHVGFADVWYRGRFAWEYKGPRKDLDEALIQVRQYAGALDNPPLLVVSDMQRIRVVSQFTGYVTRTWEISIAELKDAKVRAKLHDVWVNPEAFKPEQTRDAVTLEAARQFAMIADRLRVNDRVNPHQVAHFLIRILFCLFAENNGLLPRKHFTQMMAAFRGVPTGFMRRVADIFDKMAAGGFDGNVAIRYFNGDLFTNAREDLVTLSPEDLTILWHATAHDWSSVAPAIFGTLFERGLDPAKRSQIGAHYTSEADILDVVEPVVLAPLRRQWSRTRARLDALAERQQQRSAEATRLLSTMLEAISRTTVLDPACGSGNFLYVTLKLLHDLEFEVLTWQVRQGLQPSFPTVGPHQLHGIEINAYAAELARAVIWIGHLQWMLEHGHDAGEPVLARLDNIVNTDALIDPATGTKPPWPTVTCIVSNPPFLGIRRLRAELGDVYVDQLWQAYDGEVSRESDLVCYFVERARDHLAADRVKRVGLITTNSIRGGANRQSLDRIKATVVADVDPPRHADLFFAWSDRPWILEGAAVRISIVGFDQGEEQAHLLNGGAVGIINTDLTSSTNLTQARRLAENAGIAFQGINKGGAFDIDQNTAQYLLPARGNPNGRSNADVVKRLMNGFDVMRQSRNMWIIDFNDLPLDEAALYEQPFEYLKKHVFPVRSSNKREHRRIYWWQFAEIAPNARRSIEPLKRYIATPRIAKHRLFVWLDAAILPDCQLIAIARDDDYTFGVLHSHAHEIWSLRMGTSLEDRPRYTPTTCFETFPFPHPTDVQREMIAEAARVLARQRDAWLNPVGASAAELKQRTLTALYNARPQWLLNAHAALDRAVYAAYGWPTDIGDEEILRRLLAENLARAGSAVPVPDEGEDDGSEADEEDEADAR